MYLRILLPLFFCTLLRAQCSVTAVCSNTTGCVPLQASFTCPQISQGNAMWSIESNTVSGITVSHIFANPGLYTVTLTVTISTTPTCVATSTLMMNVVTGPANGCAATIGLNELAAEGSWFIYPNPGQGVFELRFERETRDRNMVLLNALGQKMLEGPVQKETSIQCPACPNGVYQLLISENGRFAGSKKLVID